MEQTNSKVQQQLQERIVSGEYDIGKLIVPQQFQKVTLENNKLKIEKITMSGRKIALEKIRQNILIKNRKYMRLRSVEEIEKNKDDIIRHLKFIHAFDICDQDKTVHELVQKVKQLERTRYLIMWHDGSRVAMFTLLH